MCSLVMQIVHAAEYGWKNSHQRKAMALAFFQCFEVVDPMDELKREMGCITSSWKRGSDKNIDGKILNLER